MQVPAGPPTGMPPPPPMYGPPVPPPRPSRRLPLVIAAVVVIVIVLLAAMYLLFFASSKPTVQFGTPVGNGGGFLVQVTSVSQSYEASRYRVNLLLDGIAGSPVALAYYMNVTITGNAYEVLWGDLNFDGRLTVPDGFFVTRTSGSFPNGNYTLQILWSGDGGVVGSSTFQSQGGGGPPAVSFSQASPSATGFGFQVDVVSRALSAGEYEVAFEVNATTSLPQTLSASMTFTVGSDTYDVNWTDINGEGWLTPGDAFDVTRTGGLPPGTDFTFYLIWRADGSVISTVNYSS